MKFTVCQGMLSEIVLGTIEIDEVVYDDDYALLNALADSGYLEGDEVLDVVEEEDGRIDIVDSETNYLLLSLILTH